MTMNFVGIVGSNADVSYNRKLLQYISKAYSDLFHLDIIEIKGIPLFNVSDDQSQIPEIQALAKKIQASDGVIIATPEHNYTVPPALKSFIEYMTYQVHPFEGQPVMIVGASYFSQGTSRAQKHLRSIFEAPGAGAFVYPGNEFLLGNCKEAFDAQGNLKDEGTQKFLRSCLESFIDYAEIIGLKKQKEAEKMQSQTDATTGASETKQDATSSASQSGPIQEDLFCTNTIDTTITDIDMNAEDWVEQASKKTDAARGGDYVLLNRGIMTVDQLNSFLKAVPYEVTYADNNNQFIYYNRTKEKADMLGGRQPGQVGSPLGVVHPERTYHNVSWVIEQLRSGAEDAVRVRIPGAAGQFKVHNYMAMRDRDGNYRGIHEMIIDLQPWVDWYFEQTGGKVVSINDATSSASESADKPKAEPDATSSASTKEEETDAVTSATSKAATMAEDLWASQPIDTTITGVDREDPEWVEKAAELVGAAKDDDYVELDRGVLTVNQINWLLESLPYEATFADKNNQFLYYNYTKEKADMLGGRQPWQVGLSLAEVHPDRAFAGAAWVAHQLRTGREHVRVRIPGAPGQFKVHNYIRMEDENGDYAGIHEMIFDLQPWIDFYLEHNQGSHHAADATSGASQAVPVEADAVSGSSVTELTMNPGEAADHHPNHPAPDHAKAGDYKVRALIQLEDAQGQVVSSQDMSFNMAPWLAMYLEQTGQQLVPKHAEGPHKPHKPHTHHKPKKPHAQPKQADATSGATH